CAGDDAAYVANAVPLLRKLFVAPGLVELREGFEMHRTSAPGLAGEPRLLGGERQYRRQPRDERLENLIDDGERGAPLHARIGLAVKCILADVEVERRQLGVHEMRENSDDLALVVSRVRRAHLGVELGQAMQHEPLELELAHVLELYALVGCEMRQGAEHPAQRV